MHDCHRFVWPSSNQEYWVPKIQKNAERDKANIQQLQSHGWQVITIWECQLNAGAAEETLLVLAEKIRNNNTKTF